MTKLYSQRSLKKNKSIKYVQYSDSLFSQSVKLKSLHFQEYIQKFKFIDQILWNLNYGLIFKRVICTLESIDSIKLLKRTPQHIFVEVKIISIHAFIH
ncbi:hypothetical protein Avbf_15637 [Armadillidium vulgare]|nr:hypothetical protein Avbf_15637 [Armadillidium vulgare]